MEMYNKAYNHYLTKCEDFGIEGIEFNEFKHHITFEQVEEMILELN